MNKCKGEKYTQLLPTYMQATVAQQQTDQQAWQAFQDRQLARQQMVSKQQAALFRPHQRPVNTHCYSVGNTVNCTSY